MTAKIIVINKPEIAPFLSPANIAWCAQVTLAPEESNKIVFNVGMAAASKASIPTGGQAQDNSTEGDNAE